MQIVQIIEIPVITAIVINSLDFFFFIARWEKNDKKKTRIRSL
jgi:hypothetical protein